MHSYTVDRVDGPPRPLVNYRLLTRQYSPVLASTLGARPRTATVLREGYLPVALYRLRIALWAPRSALMVANYSYAAAVRIRCRSRSL